MLLKDVVSRPITRIGVCRRHCKHTPQAELLRHDREGFLSLSTPQGVRNIKVPTTLLRPRPRPMALKGSEPRPKVGSTTTSNDEKTDQAFQCLQPESSVALLRYMDVPPWVRWSLTAYKACEGPCTARIRFGVKTSPLPGSSCLVKFRGTASL